MTRPGTTQRNRRRNRWIVCIGIAVLALFAIAQAEGMLTPLGHQLADEYSRTDFYPPQER